MKEDAMKTTEELMTEVLVELRTVLRPEDHQEAGEELAAGEPGVAFEVVCAQLHEYDLRLPHASYLKLREVGMRMNLPAKKWEILLPLVD
jgi:hypothetical protein